MKGEKGKRRCLRFLPRGGEKKGRRGKRKVIRYGKRERRPAYKERKKISRSFGAPCPRQKKKKEKGGEKKRGGKVRLVEPRGGAEKKREGKVARYPYKGREEKVGTRFR